MTRKNISNALNNISTEYIEKAADYKVTRKARKSVWRIVGSMAACLYLCALISLGVWQRGMFGDSIAPVTPEQSENHNIQQDNSNETTEKIDTYISVESSWAYDVSVPENVIENADYFVKIRVKTQEETKYFVKNTIMPSSTYNVEVLEVISPENAALPKDIKIAAAGGVVSMEEYVNTLDAETKQKTETDKLSKEDLQKKILIANESYYRLEEEKEYYVCLCDLTQDADYKGYYGMPEGGYDVFLEKDGTYVNVLYANEL